MHRRVAVVRRRVMAFGGRVNGVRQEFVDRGTATAEYAIATLAACAFAGLLLVILRSGEVRDLLFGIIRRALSGV
jgi:hypothetical protein